MSLECAQVAPGGWLSGIDHTSGATSARSPVFCVIPQTPPISGWGLDLLFGGDLCVWNPLQIAPAVLPV